MISRIGVLDRHMAKVEPHLMMCVPKDVREMLGCDFLSCFAPHLIQCETLEDLIGLSLKLLIGVFLR